jgi:TfoX N-terminal domain
MKNEYFDTVTTLLKQARPGLAATHQLTFKNVFGAVAGYVKGHIFISCGKFGVALRLPPEVLGELFKDRGVKHLKYFPNGHVKKEYAVLPKRVMEDERQFNKLLGKSIEYSLLSEKGE